MQPKKDRDFKPTSMDAPKVLIADDDETTRILLRMSLTQWGYQVVEASDGEEAWKVLQKPDPPQILVLDWLMPNLDGISLCKRIENGLSYRPYIIFLTRMAGTENMIQGLEAGADEFILKPFDLPELRIRVFAGERIIKYRQQIEEQNKQLQNYIDNMKKMAAEYVTHVFSFPDLTKLLLEIRDALSTLGAEAQEAKVEEWQGKINNFIDIIKNLPNPEAVQQKIPKFKYPVTAAVPPISTAYEGETIVNMPRMQAFFGKDLPAIEDFIKTFISLAKKQIAEIEIAIKQKDIQSAKYYFHLLGSASGNSGMMQIYDVCGTGESESKVGHWEKVQACYENLNSMINRLEKELEHMRLE